MFVLGDGGGCRGVYRAFRLGLFRLFNMDRPSISILKNKNALRLKRMSNNNNKNHLRMFSGD